MKTDGVTGKIVGGKGFQAWENIGIAHQEGLSALGTVTSSCIQALSLQVDQKCIYS